MASAHAEVHVHVTSTTSTDFQDDVTVHYTGMRWLALPGAINSTAAGAFQLPDFEVPVSL